MNLPSWFFEPAPLRQPGVLSAEVEKRYWRSRGASLSLLRLVATLGGVSLAIMFLFVRDRWAIIFDPAAWNLARVDVWVGVLLVTSAVLVAMAGVWHRWEWYLKCFRIAGGVYLAALTVHVSGLLTGGSVLEELHLADYTGYAVALLLISMPRLLGIPLAILTIVVASGSHQGLPISVDNLMEGVWGFLIILPFLLLLLSAMRTTEEIDLEARRRHGGALRMARSRSLLDAESRFLGYLHDQVLHHLDGVRRGLISPDPLPVTFPEDMRQVAKPLPVRVERSVMDLLQSLHRLDPELEVKLPDELSGMSNVPPEAMSLISDAAVEALDNSMKHAPNAARSAEISLEIDADPECRSLKVVLRDEGPGFCPYNVPAERAGVRVSILGRMSSAPGLSAEIDSAPGKGTTVFLSWQRPEAGQEERPCPQSADIIEGVFDMGTVFTPVFGVFTFLFFMLMGFGHQRSDWGEFILALVLLALAIGGVLRGDKNKLPMRNTVFVALCLFGYICVVAHESIGLARWWPPLWYTSIFVFMCVLLAMRNRALVAWGLLLLGILSVFLLEDDPEIVNYLSWYMLVGGAALMVPGTLFPLALRWLLSSLNSNLVEDSAREADLIVAATRRSYISDSANWLEMQIGAVLNPQFPAEQRIHRANLLELRLRDAIRSPGFDVKGTNREVWRARKRGITVRLQDDRSDERGVDPVPLPLTHSFMHRRLQAELRDAEVKVSVRMLPVGRRIYATILVESVGENGDPQVEQIQIPTGVTSQAETIAGSGGASRWCRKSGEE
ncbi:hypothetical protein [Corynebacterium sp. A21]|uniref:hypothetical protein n=1 Tax=Corynebacterium sp. A21 TaxID=3457318 RepID=UPI003FD4EE47